jgi:P2 family phage contractile tail tube protein
MIISGNVIAQKVLSDGIEIDDNVSVQLPSIEQQTSDIKGAGIMGTISMPTLGQFNSMTVSLNQRSINKNASNLAKPGTQNLEIRLAKDVNGEPQSVKIFVTGVNKKYDPGKVENMSTMDGSIDFEALRYRQIINGEETLLIDKQNYIFKVNGVDYMEQVRAALG